MHLKRNNYILNSSTLWERKVISQEQLIDDLGENSTLLSMEKINKRNLLLQNKMPNAIETISIIKKFFFNNKVCKIATFVYIMKIIEISYLKIYNSFYCDKSTR